MSTAVLLLAHGTPASLDDIPAYLRNITGGRPLPDSVMEEVRHRYGLIGRSPLTDITLRQATLLQEMLGVPVYAGMRNWHPYIADVVKQMLAEGITRAVALCLAPHNSRTSVGLYRSALEQAAAGALELDFISDWHDEPLLIAAFAARLQPLLTPDTPVIFTAHSVPLRTIESAAGDPYAQQTRQTAGLIAQRLNLRADLRHFAFQSQGMSGGPWIGPTVESTLDVLQSAGHSRVVLQPVGFVCDHVEILYDIDIAFKQYAAERGITLTRPESLNDSPTFIAALAHIARARLGAAAAK